MSILSSIIDVVTGRESVKIKAASQIFTPGQIASRAVICHRCEEELGPAHDDEACSRIGLSRRVFFGLMGASAAALAARIEGVPIPGARIQVIARAGDMFEVETLNPFSIAWEGARTKTGNPFKTDDGVIAEGGILQFHGQDLARPDKWLRVHRGLSEMNILGLLDTNTGKPVKYRIVRHDDAEARVGQAYKRVMQDHQQVAAGAITGIRSFMPMETRQVPVDSAQPNREGLYRAKAVTSSGNFLIDYTAGKTKAADKVEWRREDLVGHILIPGSVEDKRRRHFKGDLHRAISEVNDHYPENAAAIKAAIMGCNPEYRRRVAPIRSVESDQKQAFDALNQQKAAVKQRDQDSQKLKKASPAEQSKLGRLFFDDQGQLISRMTMRRQEIRDEYAIFDEQRIIHRAKQAEESRVLKLKKKGILA